MIKRLQMVIEVFFIVEYSSEASSSSGEPDVREDEWNWKGKENIDNIKQFTETTGINCSVLQRFGTNATPLYVFKQVLCNDFF